MGVISCMVKPKVDLFIYPFSAAEFYTADARSLNSCLEEKLNALGMFI